MPDLYIGNWSSDEPIDISGVPLTMAVKDIVGASLVRSYDCANGGAFTARYQYAERRNNGNWIYRLARVEELMPPRPPQIQGYRDDRRLPMMDKWGYSASLEAEQRKREWAEVLQRA